MPKILSRHLLALLVLAPAALAAQPSSDVHHRNDCRLAARVVTTGHPAPKAEWAHSYITSCGAEGGAAAAAMLRRLRTSTDSALLRRRTAPLGALRDSALFEAALDVAGDRAASVPARVHAFRTIVRMRDARATVDYADLVAPFEDGIPTARCRGARSFDGEHVEGTPLPADWRTRARTLALRVYRDAGEPEPVRSAASCG